MRNRLILSAGLPTPRARMRSLSWRPGTPPSDPPLWERVSRPLISLVAVESRFPRGSGRCGEAGGSPCYLASRGPGLLVRRWRSSVAPSTWSHGGGLKDCDHADGTPAACLVAWRGAPERCTARVARLDIVRSAERSWMGIEGTMSNPARPGGSHIPADSGAAPARPGERCSPRTGYSQSRASPLR